MQNANKKPGSLRMRPVGYAPDGETLSAALSDGVITPVTSVEELKGRFRFIRDNGEAIALMRQACRRQESEAGSVLVLTDGDMTSVITTVVDPGDHDGGVARKLAFQALGSLALDHHLGLGDGEESPRSEYLITAMPAFSYNSSHLKQIDDYGDYLVSFYPKHATRSPAAA